VIWQTPLTKRFFSWILIVSSSTTLLAIAAPDANAGIFDAWFRRRSIGRAERGTGGAASIRDEGCNAQVSDIPLLALVPPDDSGLTTQDHPTLFFYVPVARSKQVTQAEFMLLDEQQAYVFDRPIQVELPPTPGLTHFTLPATTQPLAANQRYNWYFSIICDAEEPSRNPSISGWIQRITPSLALAQDLQRSPDLLHYRAYDEDGIWYDALASLAMSDRDPNSQALWSQILTTFGVENIPQQSILELTPIQN
jgi:Domain of Unknown Function (DUF928)